MPLVQALGTQSPLVPHWRPAWYCQSQTNGPYHLMDLRPGCLLPQVPADTSLLAMRIAVSGHPRLAMQRSPCLKSVLDLCSHNNSWEPEDSGSFCKICCSGSFTAPLHPSFRGDVRAWGPGLPRPGLSVALTLVTLPGQDELRCPQGACMVCFLVSLLVLGSAPHPRASSRRSHLPTWDSCGDLISQYGMPHTWGPHRLF